MAGGPGHAFRVLLVDATNTGRSVAGERILRKHLASRGIPEDVIRVTSAGLNAEDGAPMQDYARREIDLYGGNAHGFAARSLSPMMVESTDLFLCGTGIERDELQARFPRARGRSFTFAEFAPLYTAMSKAAPLPEHPAILERMRHRADYPDDWDLPPWERLSERVRVVGGLIDHMSASVADVWAAMARTVDRPRPAPAGPVCLIDAFGVTVSVHWSGSATDLLSRIGHKVWSRCLVDGRPVDAHIDVVVDADDAVRARARQEGALAYGEVDSALHYLSSAVTVRAIEARAGGPVLLHAAGLATESGDVMGFIAPSGSGKTTLARTLGAHFGYVTDETLAIDAGRTVLPYPKPLSIIDGGSHVKEQWGPESLDLRPVPAGRLRLERLALLQRDVNHEGPPQVEELPLLHGLALLAEQVSYLSRLPRQLHSLADLVESVGGLVAIRYRDARDVIPLMPELIEGVR